MNAKKLQLKPGQTITVLNSPEGFEIEDAKTTHKLGKKAEAVLIFAHWHDELTEHWPKIAAALNETGILWAAYPKKSSGLETDLAGMRTWPVFENSPWQPVAMIAIDKTWSAVRLKYLPGLSQEREARADEKIYDSDGRLCVDKEARKVYMPKDLVASFEAIRGSAASQIQAYFESLSFTNKKEYVLWLIEAKKPETRKDRLAKVIDKLANGKKNPSEK
jgi:hypothetical protein